LEAVAAYSLLATYGSYDEHSNFPTLLGQAFTALTLQRQQAQRTPAKPHGAT
jgi:hypothetical protein